MLNELTITTLDNGLTVIVEQIPHVESAAYSLYIPGGVLSDPADALGCSLVLIEMSSRGAGQYDSRQLSDAFDCLGIRHGESASQELFTYRGSLLAEHLDRALELVALMTLHPTLPEAELEPIRSVLIQELNALDDNPASKAMTELLQRYYPEPYGRCSLGTLEGLQAVSADCVRSEWEQKFHPSGAVLSVAGKVEASAVLESAQRHFGMWQGRAVERPAFGTPVLGKNYHLPTNAAQLQICMAYPSAPFGHPCYYAAKVATAVLSGGMFGRLFIEVREKRGLCYSVSARHSATREFGTVNIYAGTTPDRAQETLDVLNAELRALHGTVTAEELTRAKVDLLAALVIGEESTSARASSNAGDWWVNRRVRRLDEIKTEIERVGAAEIDAYLERFPVEPFSLLTLGARELRFGPE
ncbi:MAG: insulinase family protein [Deltaproteobacteria bacterium]|nr:insulinase family protein [Deltaproteobacteria bacterium]